MLRPFRRVQVKDDSLNMVQDALSLALNPIITKQIIDGAFLENIKITGSTSVSISHGLGIIPRGWFVVNKNAQSDLWQTVSATPKKTIIINASNTVTISLWVF